MTCLGTLPATNATLKAVRPAATGDGYRAAADAPSATWTGVLAVYVDEQLEQRQRKDDVDNLAPSWMAIESDAAVPFALSDQVTYRPDGAAADTTRRVRCIDHFDAVGVVHLSFWDA